MPDTLQAHLSPSLLQSAAHLPSDNQAKWNPESCIKENSMLLMARVISHGTTPISSASHEQLGTVCCWRRRGSRCSHICTASLRQIRKNLYGRLTLARREHWICKGKMQPHASRRPVYQGRWKTHRKWRVTWSRQRLETLRRKKKCFELVHMQGNRCSRRRQIYQ